MSLLELINMENNLRASIYSEQIAKSRIKKKNYEKLILAQILNQWALSTAHSENIEALCVIRQYTDT